MSTKCITSSHAFFSGSSPPSFPLTREFRLLGRRQYIRKRERSAYEGRNIINISSPLKTLSSQDAMRSVLPGLLECEFSCTGFYDFALHLPADLRPRTTSPTRAYLLVSPLVVRRSRSSKEPAIAFPPKTVPQWSRKRVVQTSS